MAKVSNSIDSIFLDPFYIIISKGYIILRYKLKFFLQRYTHLIWLYPVLFSLFYIYSFIHFSGLFGFIRFSSVYSILLWIPKLRFIFLSKKQKCRNAFRMWRHRPHLSLTIAQYKMDFALKFGMHVDPK